MQAGLPPNTTNSSETPALLEDRVVDGLDLARHAGTEGGLTFRGGRRLHDQWRRVGNKKGEGYLRAQVVATMGHRALKRPPLGRKLFAATLRKWLLVYERGGKRGGTRHFFTHSLPSTSFFNDGCGPRGALEIFRLFARRGNSAVAVLPDGLDPVAICFSDEGRSGRLVFTPCWDRAVERALDFKMKTGPRTRSENRGGSIEAEAAGFSSTRCSAFMNRRPGAQGSQSQPGEDRELHRDADGFAPARLAAR